MVLNGSLDPQDEILIPRDDFVQECRATDAISPNLTVDMMEGHNHISPVLALGTAIPTEEAWGRQVIDFIHASSQRRE